MRSVLPSVSALTFLLASCGQAATGEKPPSSGDERFKVERVASFNEPWAMAFDKGTGVLFVTEKKGHLRYRMPDGQTGEVAGVPKVDYGEHGGLGDFIFAPGQNRPRLDRRVVYLTWTEAGSNDTRGEVAGRANLICNARMDCHLEDLKIIWRQVPKVTGRIQYGGRLTFSPDGKYLFISSGERQKGMPAQDLGSNLGKIVRLLPEGTAAPGNPFAGKGAPTDQIWTYGHRNILGLAFDPQGRLWGLEHGPKGGDEINLIKPGLNYGWPLVSNGDNYDGTPIPRHSTRPDLAAPAISWNPVIAPGDFIFYTGDRFPAWKGQALIASFAVPGVVRVRFDGEKIFEEARYTFDNRIREIRQEPDGAVWLLEDGPAPDSGHLLRLVPVN